jgi:hypothetical protein
MAVILTRLLHGWKNSIELILSTGPGVALIRHDLIYFNRWFWLPASLHHRAAEETAEQGWVGRRESWVPDHLLFVVDRKARLCGRAKSEDSNKAGAIQCNRWMLAKVTRRSGNASVILGRQIRAGGRVCYGEVWKSESKLDSTGNVQQDLTPDLERANSAGCNRDAQVTRLRYDPNRNISSSPQFTRDEQVLAARSVGRRSVVSVTVHSHKPSGSRGQPDGGCMDEVKRGSIII